MFDPIQNLIDAATKVASELSSDDPAAIERIAKRRHILAGSLRVHVRNLEAARASQAEPERDEDPNNTFRAAGFAGFAANH